MLWSILLTIALVTMALVHWRFRRGSLRALDASRREIEKLKALEQRRAVQIESQQQALFNSMVEGLLLLDENARIQIANRAFVNLFDIRESVRGKTILEV